MGLEASHLRGELASDGGAVAHGQWRLIVGQLLEAGEAVIPVGWIVGSCGGAPIPCSTEAVLSSLSSLSHIAETASLLHNRLQGSTGQQLQQQQERRPLARPWRVTQH